MLKFISTSAFLLFIYSKVDLSELLESLKHFKLETILLCLTLYASSQVISALKWKVLSQNHAPLTSYLRAYFTGMFVSSSGLGVIGGDMTRAIIVQKHFKNLSSALSSVIVDRFHGLFCLASLGFIFSTFGYFLNDNLNIGFLPKLSIYNASFIAACLAALMIVLRNPSLKIKTLNKIKEKLSFLKLSRYLKFLKQPSIFLKTSFLSALSHFLQILIYYFILRTLELQVPLVFLLAAVPIVNIMSSLPLSYQGLGIREFLLYYFLKDFGLSVTECTLTGAAWLVFALSINLTSGLLMLSPNKKLKGKIIVPVSKKTVN